MRTIADYRQLNDALFHAGLNSSQRLHLILILGQTYAMADQQPRNSEVDYPLKIR